MLICLCATAIVFIYFFSSAYTRKSSEHLKIYSNTDKTVQHYLANHAVSNEYWLNNDEIAGSWTIESSELNPDWYIADIVDQRLVLNFKKSAAIPLGDYHYNVVYQSTEYGKIVYPTVYSLTDAEQEIYGDANVNYTFASLTEDLVVPYRLLYPDGSDNIWIIKESNIANLSLDCATGEVTIPRNLLIGDHYFYRIGVSNTIYQNQHELFVNLHVNPAPLEISGPAVINGVSDEKTPNQIYSANTINTENKWSIFQSNLSGISISDNGVVSLPNDRYILPKTYKFTILCMNPNYYSSTYEVTYIVRAAEGPVVITGPHIDGPASVDATFGVRNQFDYYLAEYHTGTSVFNVLSVTPNVGDLIQLQKVDNTLVHLCTEPLLEVGRYTITISAENAWTNFGELTITINVKPAVATITGKSEFPMHYSTSQTLEYQINTGLGYNNWNVLYDGEIWQGNYSIVNLNTKATKVQITFKPTSVPKNTYGIHQFQIVALNQYLGNFSIQPFALTIGIFSATEWVKISYDDGNLGVDDTDGTDIYRFANHLIPFEHHYQATLGGMKLLSDSCKWYTATRVEEAYRTVYYGDDYFNMVTNPDQSCTVSFNLSFNQQYDPSATPYERYIVLYAASYLGAGINFRYNNLVGCVAIKKINLHIFTPPTFYVGLSVGTPVPGISEDGGYFLWTGEYISFRIDYVPFVTGQLTWSVSSQLNNPGSIYIESGFEVGNVTRIHFDNAPTGLGGVTHVVTLKCSHPLAGQTSITFTVAVLSSFW
ncbi:MAG: hypothetical protein LBC33_01070 [Mycoplasmataceae bacterium]|nr:hypothetical protein [Mycoplasmataceae bacterium]